MGTAGPHVTAAGAIFGDRLATDGSVYLGHPARIIM